MRLDNNFKKIVLMLFLVTLIKTEGAKLFVKETILPVVQDTAAFQNRLKELNKYYSNKKLGSFVQKDKTFFRLFAPSASAVTLCLFDQPEDKSGPEYKMLRDKDGVWEISIKEILYGKFYGYKVAHPNHTEKENNIICIDPYAKAVTTYTTYMNPKRAIVTKEDDYDWGGDKWIQRDWRDLIIYEMHIRDLTADPTSGAKVKGTYESLAEKGIKGGLNYVKSLGINTVELLPSQEFGNIEIPYKDSLSGRYNNWNPYERNHWGYMTSAYFAPAAYYYEGGDTLKWNTWIGKSGGQVNAFKDMVKAFHKEGIGVMMDVVYNHLSEYETGNLKQIDKEYYFRLDDKGNYIAESYCGNDLKTERPMVRRMIVESILYWMKEYHVDGFRFDLGKLIDWGTIEEIIREAKKVNPKVVFVCEPWGGGYDPEGFSQRGWGAWNDQIRNGIKGENPENGLGWIFGKWYGNNSRDRIKSYVNGTLVKDKLGLFHKKDHSVNYLESHDGYTFGDFIRIASREVNPAKIITDPVKNAKLTPYQSKLNKLGALFLLTSQGISMISEGQEFARSKVIPMDIRVPDAEKGKIDHNSYNKDNQTNYLNFNYAEMNSDLLDYYRGLISLRNKYAAFRKAEYENIVFYDHPSSEFGLAYILNYKKDTFVVLFNADQKSSLDYSLPEGTWEILADKDKAGIKSLGEASGKINLEPVTGMVLKKK